MIDYCSFSRVLLFLPLPLWYGLPRFGVASLGLQMFQVSRPFLDGSARITCASPRERIEHYYRFGRMVSKPERAMLKPATETIHCHLKMIFTLYMVI